MTYRINPEIAKIESPVKIIWAGETGNSPNQLRLTDEHNEWTFDSGKKACEAVFDKQYNVLGYKAVNSSVEINVYSFMEPVVLNCD